MLKFTLIKAIFAVALTMITILSCNKESPIVDPIKNENGSGLTEEQIEKNRNIFSQVLARSLKNENVRILLKKASLKRINKDTDVLFHLVKDEIIEKNISFHEYLASIYGDKEEFIRIVNSMPVLTILVPSVVNFNAESWNTSIQIPKVAVFPNKVYRKKNNHKFMMTYDVNVKEEELALNIFPDYPIIVVKDNERIQVNNGKVRGVKQLNSFVIRDLNYSFIDESFNNLNGTKLSSGSRLATYDKFDSKVKLAYENNLQYPRDYIYYNIAPTIGNATGSFNSSYAEHLTTIQLVNSDIIKELVDDQITDYDGYPSFADGDLEFIVKVIGINNQNNAVEIVNKWFDVPFLGLVNLYHQNNQWYYGSSTKQYILPTPLELVPWNMQQYGDQIKVVLMEEDATTSYTQSITIGISSTFGFNYSNSIKDGPNFGSNTSNTNNVSSTYSLQVSGGHDMLYDAIIRWDDKILYWDEEAIPGYPNPPFNEHWARTKEFSTGKAIITIEPIPRR